MSLWNMSKNSSNKTCLNFGRLETNSIASTSRLEIGPDKADSAKRFNLYDSHNSVAFAA